MESKRSPQQHRQVIALAALVFFIACGVRLLLWQDLRPQIDSGQMHFGMTDHYKADAKNLISGRADLFIKGPAPPNDADIITHPPGYSLLLALIFRLIGDSNMGLRLIHILVDALTAVAVFFIARELLTVGIAAISGVLVGISPQLSFTSLVLLPDSPFVLPIVWSVFLLIRASKRPRPLLIVGSGLLIGVSCWLRPNSLLLSPFLALLVLFLFKRVERLRYALLLLAATIIVIAPITIRNLVVFDHFIPLSIGVGVNITEGIADYDYENRFGLLQKDHQISNWEAETYQRPDYRRSLYSPDGIERDRERIKRGLVVIKNHPLWFATVVLRRIGYMITNEPAPIVSPIPAVTHSLSNTSALKATWASSAPEILATSQANNSPTSLSEDQQMIVVQSKGPQESSLFVSPSIPLTPGKDYVFQFPIDLRRGRVTGQVRDPQRRTLLASATVPDVFQGYPADSPATNVVQIPFTSSDHRQMQISIISSTAQGAEAQIGKFELYELGASSYEWTRYPRLILRFLQKRFTTQQMLPLILGGVVLLVIASRWRALAILLAVPLYYLLAQSPLHTEARYVISIHYFFSVFAAVTLYWLARKTYRLINRLFRRETADGGI